ncbi:MAG: hypothetical protein A2X86_12455 [Bdellovibrionales bacterium GWA2_49_15]|nr:MAG: hypothetical protein A2X86_12455 [Bdellovibrionales bacterium GWA2_49_15]
MNNKKQILITGASSDIGIGLIRQLMISKQYLIIGTCRNSERLIKLKDELGDFLTIEADLSIESDVNNIKEYLQKNNLSPSKFVHLAAPDFRYLRFKDSHWEDFQREINVQLKSVVFLLQAILPKMKQEKSGEIVFVLSSVVRGIPPAALGHYTSIKYALLGLMHSLVSEYRKTGIRINAISPSMIDTRFIATIPEKLIEVVTENHPLKRLATIEDVVPAIEFLLSERSSYINGENLFIDGAGA